MDSVRYQFNNLVEFLNGALSLFQDYAWYLVFGGLIFYYLHIKLIKPILSRLINSYTEYRTKKSEIEYNAKYHKDPDLFANRISAQQAIAQKLQEKYAADAKAYQDKLKEKERKKLEESAQTDAKTNGKKLGGDKTKNSLRSEYNPLMGPGSSSNYRAPKRSKCSGGGCG